MNVVGAPMTYDDLVLLARRFEGAPLATVTGKSFTVGIAGTGEIFFTPASSGWGQSDGRKAAERFVARYNQTGSLRPSDYAKVSRNASYFIGLLLGSAGGVAMSAAPRTDGRLTVALICEVFWEPDGLGRLDETLDEAARARRGRRAAARDAAPSVAARHAPRRSRTRPSRWTGRA